MIHNVGINKWKLDVHPRAGGARRRKTVIGTKEYAKQVHAQLAGCGKSPPAAFSRRSEAHCTARVRFASLLAAALLDGLFAHPAGDADTDTTPDLIVAYCATIEFFRSLLEKECTGDCAESRTSSNMLVSELVQLVVDDYRRNNRASLQDAKQMALRWTKECGTTRIATVVHACLLRIADKWMGTEGLSPARVNRLMAFLLRAFRLRQRDDHALVIPFWAKLKEAPARSGFVEWPYFKRLRAAMPLQGRVPSTIAFWTGMREGEILTLEWSQITFNHARNRVIIDLRADQTKSEDPRVIVMEGDLYTILAAHAKYTTRHYPTCARVCHHNGRYMSDTRYFWEPACVAVQLGTWRTPTAKSWTQRGYQRMIFHDLRRTGVRNLIRAGVPEKTAMAISGHKTRSVFERYNIINPRDLEDAGRKVADYMRLVDREYRETHGHSLDTAPPPQTGRRGHRRGSMT